MEWRWWSQFVHEFQKEVWNRDVKLRRVRVVLNLIEMKFD